MAGEVQRFASADIRIKDLVLDDFFGYRDLYEVIDENIIDRQATVVLLEIYGSEGNIPADPPIIIKEFVAALVEKRMLPGLRTFIAAKEERSDVQREGYLTYYDQLNMLNHFEQQLDRKITELRAKATSILVDDYAEAQQYDTPKATNSGSKAVTYDPHHVGKSLFLVNGRRRTST